MAENDNMYPVLPLRDQVPFPGQPMPILVGRSKSKAAVRSAELGNSHIVLLMQRGDVENPSGEDFYKVGALAVIKKRMAIPDGSVKLLVDVCHRVVINKLVVSRDLIRADCSRIVETVLEGAELTALIRQVKRYFSFYASLMSKDISAEIVEQIKGLDSPGDLADIITPIVKEIKIEDRQRILEIANINDRLSFLLRNMMCEVEILRMSQSIHKKVRENFEKTQKQQYINEQLRQLRKELGEEGTDEEDDQKNLIKLVKTKKMPKATREKLNREFRKLRVANQNSMDYGVVRNYLEWVVSLPWEKYSDVKFDYDAAKKVLDKHHFGLDKVKERILEYLAVQKIVGKPKGSVICFVGSPGTGKSTLGRAIAEATGRKFIKISLGGVRDEAEIRGHRRTYIGAMPGRLVASLSKCECGNPVILLDEIDKITRDSFRGDPAAALLEVLDPAQNYEFVDHYLDVPYDLSKVMFICTANTLDTIPPPLLDRLEVIPISMYTQQEKFVIARDYLIPKQNSEHGISMSPVGLTEKAIKDVVAFWTKEAGVRGLDREIAKICRKVATEYVRNKKRDKRNLTEGDLVKYLGAKKFESMAYRREPDVGIVNGLAYTQVGGSLLVIEVGKVKGKGRISCTGRLGKVITESSKIAMSAVQLLLERSGWDSSIMDRYNFHMHLPEGGVPKDGPSAGIAMATAFFSLMTNVKIRSNIAMTGEMTLMGQVLPIGGLKEKLIAAYNEGIKTVLIPKANAGDLQEALTDETKQLEVIQVSNIEQVLRHALQEPFDTVIKGVGIFGKNAELGN